MAEVATIARPYAEAAFSLAESTGKLGPWSDAFARLAVVAASPDIANLLGNPRVSAAQLIELLASLSGSTDEALRNFVSMLVDNKRVLILPAVHEQFEALKNIREATVDASIESALPLDDSQVTGLVADLEHRFKRKIRPHVSVVPELIGGVCVTVGDEVIDGSVRGKLASMATALKN